MSKSGNDTVIVFGGIIAMICAVFIWANTFVWSAAVGSGSGWSIVAGIVLGLTVFVVLVCVASSEPQKPVVAKVVEQPREYQ